MSPDATSISVVLPTFNRLEALRTNFGSLVALAAVSEIVVVVDGSTDGTEQWLADHGDPRVRVITQPNRGSPAARNAGIDAARSEWILMTEDDCYLPADYAVVLLEVASACRADIVSAPWVQIDAVNQIPDALARGRRDAEQAIGLSTYPGVFPAHDVETPFLNGIALVRRAVFDVVQYDEALRGNAWREETDMFLTAVRAGFCCVLTPKTASFQLGQWAGGQHGPRLSYELWSIRNNWRFLRKNRDQLRALGQIRAPVTAQIEFVVGRVVSRAAGFAGARWRRRRTGAM